MNPPVRTIWLQALVLGAMLTVLVPARADEAAERERISRERAEATARHERQRRECEQRFAVTACVDEARAEHRQTMMRLRRQEALLDEAQRKQRAAQRLAAIEQKGREERGVAAPRASASAAEPRRPRAPSLAASRPAASASAASAPERRADEARSRARFDARQRDAAARREAAEQRRVEREKAGKPPAAPLPDPAAR
ncbi:MAG: hypothetical protein QM722_14945 [Piscinibacter sp.]